jgi:uncharacterized protein
LSGSGFLFDANVWVALSFAAHVNHPRAAAVISAATVARPAIFCRSTEQSLLRLLSTPTILQTYGVAGLSNRDALATMNRLFKAPNVSFREEPPGIAPLWHQLAALPTASPKVWMDAYLAAFAIAGDLEMITFDKAFSQFAGLTATILASASP